MPLIPLNRSTLFCAALVLAAGAAWAIVPEAPSLKPSRQDANGAAESRLLTPPDGAAPSVILTPAPPTMTGTDAVIVKAAIEAAERSQWAEVARLQTQSNDPVVRDLILWIRASNGVPGLGFEELDAAIKKLDGWPKQDAMFERGEAIIELSSLGPRERIAWLQRSGPRTGEGKVAFAMALSDIGERDRAHAVIRDAWRNHALDDGLDRRVQSQFATVLDRADHEARTDFLLWTGRRTQATAMKSFLNPDWRALVDARIALQTGGRRVDQIVNAVPGSLADQPGFLYDRARYRRALDNQEGATSLLTGINGNSVPVAGRNRLWDERNLAMREDYKTSNWSRAYQLAASHGLSSGEDFAEAEFASGWISLRMKNDAARGLKHFEALERGVTAPVSTARANYWKGRANESLGQTVESRTAYSKAAAHRFTYYGQLAAERINERQIEFVSSGTPTGPERLAFEGRPVVRAMKMLGAAGAMSTFRTFAYSIDDTLESKADYVMLAELANAFNVPDVGVRAGKAGLAKGIVTPEAAYPLVHYPLLSQPAVERSLMLAITRQETEMNPVARSSVGARGLMQLMPATAKSEARRIGLAYNVSRLNDPSYNMTLGGHHLDNLLGDFNGSYIMTAAAYNAGGSRPRRWAEVYGDPRTGAIDPVDWVEFIPFSETRNYVQRVMENTQVYRHRISGEPEDIRLTEDLRRGRR